ncbi:ornithine cyclodeaminase/alanine dehydrogenase-like protein (mu-crystallin family) [Catenulispora sp. EB89]|uniref:ornithine cyclodeaminase family protein n=1 Tax=Catenulispora sp. EB89 TaxID=3156257 RepID=UPI003518153D
MSTSILYLSEHEVTVALRSCDAVKAVAEALMAHSRGETLLPAEAALRWTSPDGEPARSLALPGGVPADPFAYGIKIINASLGNVRRGLPRASGLTLMFDAQTARVAAVLASGPISATRTAAVSYLAVRELSTRSAHDVAIIGAGALARAHMDLVSEQMPQFETFHVFDIERGRAEALAEEYRERLKGRGAQIQLARSAEEAVRAADVVIPVTTTNQGYIEYAWLRPGALVINVSLDDVQPEVIMRADRLVVDDWSLVADDTTRVLGRLIRARSVVAPGAEPADGGRRVDAELGAVLAGTAPGRNREEERVVVNPFGMGIGDVAVADAVLRTSRSLGLGMELER